MPTLAEALQQAWEIHQAGRIAHAEQIYRQVLAAQPDHASAWCFLGIACHDQQRYDEAIAAYRNALALRPNFPSAHNNLGNTYRMLRRVDDAVAQFDQALALDPQYLLAYKNKGTTLCWEGRLEEAQATYEEAIRRGVADADIHKSLGILRLLRGDWEGGWPEYAWRWQTGEIRLPTLSAPLWDGSSLDGKTILLTPEQGLGDTIQFIRYAAWLKQRYDCRVLCQPPKVLRELLASCPGVDAWVERLDEAPPHDCFAPLIHVPGVLRHTPDDFPAPIPYLAADEARVAEWRQRLAGYRGVKVGLVWRGSPTHHADSMRSIPLVQWAALGRLAGVHWLSLQKGPAVGELSTLAGRLEVVDLGSSLDEGTGAFVETAAVLKNLDLLITCDTAIAHVAGALGVPVWLLLGYVPDWRWGRSGSSTVWYPTMELFRQKAVGEWGGVLEEVAQALERRWPTIVRRKHYTEYHLATSGFNRLTRTPHGLMLYNRHDRYIGRSIERYGEFSLGEIELFRQAVQPGWHVVEAGANIGAHTLILAQQVGPRGRVYAFEPQRVLFQTLCANMALNSLTHVYCRQEALGAAAGTTYVPWLDYNAENNFGGLSLTHRQGEPVPVVPLDSLDLPRCDFLKIDVEGMELEVLRGASQTIQRFRPLLYVENDRPEQSAELIRYLQELGYELYWHLPPLYSPHNSFRNPENEFGRTVSVNMLGVHRSVPQNISGLAKVEGPHSDWRTALRGSPPSAARASG
jgi:FkbM family methyltransferase